MLHLGSPEETHHPFTSEVNAPFLLLFKDTWGVRWGFVLFCCVCLGSIFFVVGRLLWVLGFLPPTSRQPAREPDGEPGSLCVRLVHMRAKLACVSVHGTVCV